MNQQGICIPETQRQDANDEVQDYTEEIQNNTVNP